MEVVYNGEDVTVEVTFNPGWYKPGTFHDPPEGENAEIISIDLESEGDITLKLGQKELDKVQKACDDYDSRQDEPFDEPDDYIGDDDWQGGQDAWEASQGI
jgi:hypothetical protein